MDYVYQELAAEEKEYLPTVGHSILVVKAAIESLKDKMDTKMVGKTRVNLHDKKEYEGLLRKRKTLRKIQKQRKRGYDNPTLAQAMKRSDWSKWEKAIKAEYDQLEKEEGVFDFLKDGKKLPPGANLLGSMLVLVIKRKPDGSIDKYKARLVALGNQQKPNSYDQIKSATARSSTVKMLMSIQAEMSCKSMVLDVKGAYLKSHIREDLNEKLYVKLPDGRVVKLRKYLYGLKQAGYEWEQNVTKVLLDLGYKQSKHDTRAFTKWHKDDFICMSTHVDDFYVISSKQKLLDRLHEELTKAYGEVSIKSSDLLAYLGVQISSIGKSGKIKISQPGYVKSLDELLKLNDDGTTDELHKDYLDKRFYHTPMKAIDQPLKNAKDRVDQLTYLRIVGAINYLAQFTRPDLLYALSRAAQRCAEPTKHDMRLVKRILKHIRCTADFGIVFKPGSIEFVCYVDSSHHTNLDGHAHFGYTF